MYDWVWELVGRGSRSLARQRDFSLHLYGFPIMWVVSCTCRLLSLCIGIYVFTFGLVCGNYGYMTNSI